MASSKSRKKGKRKKTVRKFKSELLKLGLPRDFVLRVNPPGQEKMSEVLVRFVEPYARFAETEEDYRRLYSVAALAWNAALLPTEERSTLYDLIHQSMPFAEDSTKLVIDELIHRKERYFAEYSRMIMHYDLKMMRDDVYVTVVSTMQ